jgi:hypothetical protein
LKQEKLKEEVGDGALGFGLKGGEGEEFFFSFA